VSDDDVPTGLDHVCDPAHRFDGGIILIGHRLMGLVLDQRITAYGHDRYLASVSVSH
jgi:hypothetical protein